MDYITAKHILQDCLRRADVREAIHLAVEALDDKLPWRPITDTLPYTTGRYLVSGGGEVWVADFIQLSDITYGWASPAENPVVEAWRPLPEPYSKEICIK